MKPAAFLATLFLAFVALAHLVRLVLRIEIVAAGNVIPLWASVPAFLVTALLAAALWRESRTS